MRPPPVEVPDPLLQRCRNSWFSRWGQNREQVTAKNVWGFSCYICTSSEGSCTAKAWLLHHHITALRYKVPRASWLGYLINDSSLGFLGVCSSLSVHFSESWMLCWCILTAFLCGLGFSTCKTARDPASPEHCCLGNMILCRVTVQLQEPSSTNTPCSQVLLLFEVSFPFPWLRFYCVMAFCSSLSLRDSLLLFAF